MEQVTQQRRVREIFQLIDTKSTPFTAEIGTGDVRHYTDPAHLAQEQAALFRHHPLVIGVSARLPNPGDFFTDDTSGVPILVVRDEAGRVNAFLNVCRHRGARVCPEPVGNRRYFPCPYHAWTYDQAGKLITCQDEAAFAGLDKGQFGLVQLPAEERHGLIWVVPTPGAALDVAAYLGPSLDAELAGYGIAGNALYRTETITQPFHWKLGVDTFLETFHFRFLHKDTVASLFYSNLAPYREWGLHHLLVGVRRTVEQLRAQPPERWTLLPHAALVYLLFPNTVLVWQLDHVELWQVYPARERDDACALRISLLIPEPAATDSARRHWDRNWDLLLRTTLGEDFVVAAGIQQGLASGTQTRVTYGRNEPALQHFHRALREALSESVGGSGSETVPVLANRTR